MNDRKNGIEQTSAIDTLLLVACLLWNFISKINRFPIAYARTEAIVGFFILVWCIKDLNKYRVPLLVLLSTLLFYICVRHNNNIAWSGHFISVLFMLPLSLLILRQKYSVFALSGYFYMISIYIILNANTVLSRLFDVSQNYISSYLLICLFPIFFKQKVAANIPSFVNLILLAFFGFFASVFCVGRGGILSFGILLFSLFVIFLFQKKDASYMKYFAAFASLLFFLGIYYIISNPSASQFLFARFFEKNQGVEGESRTFIYMDYLSGLSIGDFFFGKNLDSCPMVSSFNNNPHNSILATHSHYGIIGVVSLLLCFIINIVTSFKNKTYILLVFLFVVFIRAMLDTLISYGPFDVVFYVLLLLITKKSHVV